MGADRDLSGVVFNIQKFSVNDGPGIRTVVFLKGCPLRCAWCANPESQLPQAQVVWDRAKCRRCGHCAEICPRGAIRLEGESVRVDPARCGGCGSCVKGCPGRALKTEGERKTVRQVLDVVLQDLPFYEESGGGLTVSGGEFLMQAAFAGALFEAAKEEGLHTCGETTGYAPREVFERTIDAVDLLLFDMKHFDAAKHRAFTGVENSLPLQNMRRALELGKDVLPRIPVIPGFNDSLTDADGLARQLKSLQLDRCQLLPFHQFGENKYDLLNRPYRYRDVPALHREELENYRQRFHTLGINAFF